ncbi:MAG: peptidylprolyl isomerase [Victivallales bacterium]|nr:peptidylprolyl isomerase [Victivallales bacterium]
MKKTQLALLAAGAVTSMYFSGSAFAADQAPAVKAEAAKVEVNADAKADAVDKWAFLPEVVAEVDGKKYTKAEVIKMMDASISKSPFAAMITPQILPRFVYAHINEMIKLDLLLKLAAADGITPSPKMVNDAVDELMKNVSPEEKAIIEQQLAAQKKTLESYKKEISENPERQKQAAIQAWVLKKIEPGIEISEADIKEFYDKNKAEFMVPEKMKVSHILIAPKDKTDQAKQEAKAKAEELLAELNAGKIKFGETAAKESTCPSKKNNGSLGLISRNDAFDPVFLKAAFALKKDELSKVVETPYGFHIIRCDDKFPEQQLSLDDAKVKKYITNMLKTRAIETIVMEKLNAAEKKYNAHIYLEAPKMPKMPAPAVKANK